MTKPNPNKARGWNIAWQILRPFTIFLCACVLTAGILSTAWKYVYSNYVMPPDPEDTTEVEFVVKRGSSVSGIARHLFLLCERSLHDCAPERAGRRGRVLV